ncbi:hypothetical protein SAMN04487976_104217 [Xaviernesmea oryzae]|nr:hypothetical protein SAMN04487976_104217 [Xaviernesmea oryzae]
MFGMMLRPDAGAWLFSFKDMRRHPTGMVPALGKALRRFLSHLDRIRWE